LCLTLALAFTVLAGCSSPAPAAKPADPAKPSTPAPAASSTGTKYKDGTYTAYSDATDNGYTKAEVTMKGDKIDSVKLLDYDNLNLAKDASYPHKPYLTVITDLPKAMVAKNSADVDAIAQATYSSNQAKQAVKRAMEKAMVTAASAAKYFDGTFMAMSPKTDTGWTIVWVKLAGDKIADVKILDTTPVTETVDGKSVQKKDAKGNVVFQRKDDKYPHKPYLDAITEMAKRIKDKNGVDGVDGIAQATHTSNQAKQAVTEALKMALRK
jgi:uncharacterized protein with FMN-binding domain